MEEGERERPGELGRGGSAGARREREGEREEGWERWREEGGGPERRRERGRDGWKESSYQGRGSLQEWD